MTTAPDPPLDPTPPPPAPPAARARRFGAGDVLALAALLVAVGVILLRREGSPLAGWLEQHLTLSRLDPNVRDHAVQVLTVPLGSVIVVLFRITLGLGMLGPFRPILIALAMQWTGAVVGATFLTVVMVLIVLLRPRLRRGLLPYYGRLSLLLAIVVLIQTTALLVGAASEWRALELTAFFPIVVLTLTADGFARALAQDGFRSAVFRGAVTLFVAQVIHVVVHFPGVRAAILGHPELLLVEIAAIFFLANHAALGVLRGMNPERAPAPRPLPTEAPAGSPQASQPVSPPEGEES